MYFQAWAILPVLQARMLILAAAHLRAALPSARARPFDPTMTILFTILVPHGQGESVVVTSIDNPGPRPVLAGLSIRRRRCPAWLDPWLGTGARRTAGRRYCADRQAALGIVPVGGISVLPVHFAAIRRRYRVVAVIGQPGRRPRVISMPLASRPEADTRSSGVAIAALFPWLA